MKRIVAYPLVTALLGVLAWWLFIPPPLQPEATSKPQPRSDDKVNLYPKIFRASKRLPVADPDTATAQQLAAAEPIIEDVVRAVEAGDRYQRYFQAPVVDPHTPAVSYGTEKMMVRWALALARNQRKQPTQPRQRDQRPQTADQERLRVAVFELGTRMLEPNAPMSAALAASDIRSMALKELTSLTPANFEKLVKAEAAYPEADAVFADELAAQERGYLLAYRRAPSKLPGLRGRTEAAIVRMLRQQRQLSDAFREYDDKAEFPGFQPQHPSDHLARQNLPETLPRYDKMISSLRHDRVQARLLLAREAAKLGPEAVRKVESLPGSLKVKVGKDDVQIGSQKFPRNTRT